MPACLREIFLFFRMEIPAYQSVCVVFVCVLFYEKKKFLFQFVFIFLFVVLLRFHFWGIKLL